MVRSLNRLTARFVASVTKTGRHADGDGLYLIVRKRGKKVERLWLFRYSEGKRGAVREVALSLGPARTVTLAKAREFAAQCRTARAIGEDPRTALTRRRGSPTFGAVADDYIDTLAPTLRSEKHIENWRLTLGDRYCRALRRRTIDQVTTDDVLEVLKPAWHIKPETAQRLRARIERVIDSATVRRLRSGPNPARWRGHLQLLLPKPKQLSRGHHPAWPWREMRALMARLRVLNSVSARALEWTILTAARTGETIGARWAEIERDQRLWIVPAERMKAGREHRVPLCDRCLELLDEAEVLGGDFIFRGRTKSHPLSNMAMAECLKGLTAEASVHGFRSSFRDWVSDATRFPDELAEVALAHVNGNKTERAYRRGDMLERRRALMEAWARHCDPTASGNVVDFAAWQDDEE